MLTVVIVFFGDRPDVDEKLKVGKVVTDVYDASLEADKFDFFIDKSAEYALLKSMKKNIEINFDNENDFVNSLIEEFKVNFDKYLLLSEEEIKSSDFKFVIEYKEGIRLNGSSDKELNFATLGNKKFNFTRKPSFELVFDYSFEWYNKMEEVLKLNLVCLKESKDEENIGDIAGSGEGKLAKECLNEYPNFLEVSKSSGILSIVYLTEGYLLEDEFRVPLEVNLVDFESSLNKNLA